MLSSERGHTILVVVVALGNSKSSTPAPLLEALDPLKLCYLTHHMRMISASAVLTCAANTEAQFIALKISHAAGAA